MHDIDMTTGKPAIGYFGQTPWHRLGTPLQSDWSIDRCIDESGLAYQVVAVPAFAADLDGQPKLIDGCFFNRRNDTGALLGKTTFTDQRKEVQPREIVHFINDFVSADERFKLAVLGAIRKGAQIWATASFSSSAALEVAGEKHQAFLIARTGFDGSLATHAYISMVRAVCANTLAAGWDRSAMVTVRHSTKFDPVAARKQLAELAKQVDHYKMVGDALAQNVMAESEVVALFRKLLDIPADAAAKDISTRKSNQFDDLARAYETSVTEGAPRGTAWAALQSVTRYVDHDRSTRGDDGTSETEKRFVSAQFGSGAQMKGEAWNLLMPRIKDRVPVLAN
jgi:phage/plasmid-like protein (TIGR03299 family)